MHYLCDQPSVSSGIVLINRCLYQSELITPSLTHNGNGWVIKSQFCSGCNHLYRLGLYIIHVSEIGPLYSHFISVLCISPQHYLYYSNFDVYCCGLVATDLTYIMYDYFTVYGAVVQGRAPKTWVNNALKSKYWNVKKTKQNTFIRIFNRMDHTCISHFYHNDLYTNHIPFRLSWYLHYVP